MTRIRFHTVMISQPRERMHALSLAACWHIFTQDERESNYILSQHARGAGSLVKAARLAFSSLHVFVALSLSLFLSSTGHLEGQSLVTEL